MVLQEEVGQSIMELKVYQNLLLDMESFVNCSFFKKRVITQITLNVCAWACVCYHQNMSFSSLVFFGITTI